MQKPSLTFNFSKALLKFFRLQFLPHSKTGTIIFIEILRMKMSKKIGRKFPKKWKSFYQFLLVNIWFCAHLYSCCAMAFQVRNLNFNYVVVASHCEHYLFCLLHKSYIINILLTFTDRNKYLDDFFPQVPEEIYSTR